ncbi:hypothetical protein ACFWVC_15325 [Streptomyces sp. NPDC058691]|uniref:hypothetical protein n=1 Tax=Streptomyces sp. NPDC058691 TaxID=3346601 RepID=UPI003651BB15
MRASTFVYPWDVVGDPDAAARIADLGVQQVTLASAYHSTRALTPRHPARRVVTARHAAVLYPPDPEYWAGRALRPYTQDWAGGADAYGTAAEALRAAGLPVHSWVVLAHNSRMGEEHPGITVRNAFGDRYPWAPCVARPEVRDYLVALAAEAAVRPGTDGTELESCGWYGLAHLHAHDKTGGVPLPGAAQYLMSLCFCEVCEAGYAGLGADPRELRAAVRSALEPVWAGAWAPGSDEWSDVGKLLGMDLAALTLAWRTGVAREMQRAAVEAVRAAAPPGFRVLLHADPHPHRAGANTGIDPAHVLALADGLVLPGTDHLAACVPHARPGTVLAANFPVVAGMGGSPHTLAADAARAAALGATELRLYHAGLASDADLGAVRDALSALPMGA